MTSLFTPREVRGCRRSITALVLAFLSLSLGLTNLAKAAEVNTDKSTKPAWQWTLDERLAKRFDPEAMRARVVAHAAELAAHREKSGKAWGEDELPESVSRRTDIDVIQGSKNPELFLPGELFGYLFMDAFPSEGVDPSEYRHIIEERAAALGFGSDLWTRLRKVATPVLELERKREELAGKNPSATLAKEGEEMDDDGLVLCQARIQALIKAEAEFGKDSFLRLLYEAVIPSTQVTYRVYKGMAEHQRYLEGGCK